MGVLDAFMSAWSDARRTFGEGVPSTGEQFDKSATLRRLQTNVESAAPGSRWTGNAAVAYGTANTDHGQVFAKLAALDQRLSSHVDASSQVVSSGRNNLDAVRKWVVDAAAAVPPGNTRDQMLMPIVQKGLGELSEIVTKSNGELSTIGSQIRSLDGEYRALGDQKFAVKGDPGTADGAKSSVQAVDFPLSPPPDDPGAKEQTGGYGSYHYGYQFSTNESWTQQQIAKEVMQNYNKYFTFTGDKPSIVLGEKINLDGPAGPEPVKVTQVTDHGFQFVSLPGHSEGPGRVINFDIVPASSSPVAGRLNWELRVEASGPVSGVSAIPGASWLNKGIWQIFANNLDTRLPTYPPSSGPVSV